MSANNVRLSGQMDITRWEQWVEDNATQKREYDDFMRTKYHPHNIRKRK